MLGLLFPSKHVYMGPIWAESGHLSNSTWAPTLTFYPYKTHIGPILIKLDDYRDKNSNSPGKVTISRYIIGPKWLPCDTDIGPLWFQC